MTAGSITSNITDVLDHIYLSKQTRQINNCIVPETIELFDINKVKPNKEYLPDWPGIRD